jgi:hypothetical protein
MMGVRATQIAPERRQVWQNTGWMPWDDDPLHRDWALSWKWVEESEAYWQTTFDRLRPVQTTILHGLQDTVILPDGSREFARLLLAKAPTYPLDLNLIPGDHRLSSPEHVERFHRLVLG